jgi:hypothetical protein
VSITVNHARDTVNTCDGWALSIAVAYARKTVIPAEWACRSPQSGSNCRNPQRNVLRRSPQARANYPNTPRIAAKHSSNYRNPQPKSCKMALTSRDATRGWSGSGTRRGSWSLAMTTTSRQFVSAAAYPST